MGGSAVGDGARERISAAIVQAVGESGYAATTVGEIAARAGVTREQFDALYASKEDCFYAVFADLRQEFMEIVAGSILGAGSWRDGLREAGYRAHDYCVADVPRARFLAVEVLEAGDRGAAELDQALEGLVELVHAGRFELEDPDSVDRSVAEHIVGSFWTMLASQVRAGRIEPADIVVPQLMFFATRQYLGEEVAREELTRKRKDGP